MVLADQTVVKGANFTIELLLHAFDKLTRAGIDLRHAEVNVQCDNCSKEAKSNAVLRLLSVLVGKRRLGSARLQSLQSGHSHEDIDQFFSLLGSFMSTKKELYNPEHVLNELRTYLSNPAVRPREGMKNAYMVSSTRDWPLDRGPFRWSHCQEVVADGPMPAQLSQRDGRPWSSTLLRAGPPRVPSRMPGMLIRIITVLHWPWRLEERSWRNPLTASSGSGVDSRRLSLRMSFSGLMLGDFAFASLARTKQYMSYDYGEKVFLHLPGIVSAECDGPTEGAVDIVSRGMSCLSPCRREHFGPRHREPLPQVCGPSQTLVPSSA